MTPWHVASLSAALAAFTLSTALPAAADPPPWAPAHGYRAKHGDDGPGRGKGKGRGGRDRHDDSYVIPFGIGSGVCDREQLGAVLGGALGAGIGREIGGRDAGPAATLGGAILGAVIGGSIGRRMDDTDQHCAGQALEYAEEGQIVRWRDPDGAEYRISPLRTFETSTNRFCREFRSWAVIAGREEETVGTACRDVDGRWRLRG